MPFEDETYELHLDNLELLAAQRKKKEQENAPQQSPVTDRIGQNRELVGGLSDEWMQVDNPGDE